MKIACLGDWSNHMGFIMTSGQDNTLTVNDIPVAVQGALHICPITGHGVTAIIPITVRSYHNGKLIITEYAITGCGALITPPDRKVEVE